MLKLLYKTLVVAFISGSLLLMDFNYKGQMISWNNVQAESLKLDKTESGMNMMSTLTMVVVGVLASRLYKYKMTLDIGLAAGGAVAFIGGDIIALIKNKKVMKDLQTEIVRDEKGQIDQKQIETFKKLKESYVAAKDTATTKKMLQMAASAAFAGAGIAAVMMSATEEAAQAKCLLGLQNAVSTAYTADKAVCTTKHSEFATCLAEAATTCTASTVGYEACYPPRAAKCKVQHEDPALICDTTTSACKTKISADMSQFTTYISKRETPVPSGPALLETTTFATNIQTLFPQSANVCTAPYASKMLAAETTADCPGTSMIQSANASGGTPLTVANNIQNEFHKLIFPNLKFQDKSQKLLVDNYINKVLNVILPEANAFAILDMLGVAGTEAVKFVVETSQSLATTLDLQLLIPKRRAIAWGVLSALSLAASMATGSEIGKIEGNIKKIDAILNSMNALQNGVDQTNNIATTKPTQNVNDNKTNIIGLNPNANLGINTNKASDYDLKANGGGTLPCITGATGSCESLSSKMSSLNGIQSLPAYTQAQAGDITKFADGLSGKSNISGLTQDLGRNLAGQQNALGQALKKQQQDLQDKLRKLGRKGDLASDAAKLEASMRAIVKRGLDASKSSPASMYASFGGRPIFSDSTGANTDALKYKDENDSKNKWMGGVVAIPAATQPEALSDSDLKNDKLDGVDKTAEGDIGQNGGTGSGSKKADMDDYLLKNDITQDKDSSIFDLISNRYQKSGYPRLFKKIQ
jgi:hypothetical protein